MLAADVKRLPKETGWAFEVKWDGVRAMATIEAGELRLFARRGAEITHRYPELAGLGSAIRGSKAIIDGEIVALDADGKPSFQLLQQRMGLSNPMTIQRRSQQTPVRFIGFDLLAEDGEELIHLPYEQRRERLLGLRLDDPRWQVPPDYVDDGEALLEAVRREGLEGVVAKRLGSRYRPGERSSDWLKLRIRMRQDFLIGGWLPGLGGRSERLGSVMLGVWDRTPEEAQRSGEPQRLVYVGAAGSGLSERTIEDLTEWLGSLRRADSPFTLGIGPKRSDPVWCEPELVCSVEFSEWTREDTLRQPAFKGLRDDVDPSKVLREEEPQRSGDM